MPESLDDLRDKLSQVEGIAPVVQIDVMDGRFVRERSWPYTPGGADEFRQMVEESDGLPFWNSVDFEVDLMVERPEEVIDGWIQAGVRRLIVHIESTEHMSDIIGDVASRFLIPGEEPSVELGIALNIDTPLAAVEPYMEHVSFLQFMGIAEIGYQGQPFDVRVLQKIVTMREAYPEVIISVDGGVNFETAPLLLVAGADRLAVGSALFDGDVEQNIEDFRNLADELEDEEESE